MSSFLLHTVLNVLGVVGAVYLYFSEKRLADTMKEDEQRMLEEARREVELLKKASADACAALEALEAKMKKREAEKSPPPDPAPVGLTYDYRRPIAPKTSDS